MKNASVQDYVWDWEERRMFQKRRSRKWWTNPPWLALTLRLSFLQKGKPILTTQTITPTTTMQTAQILIIAPTTRTSTAERNWGLQRSNQPCLRTASSSIPLLIQYILIIQSYPFSYIYIFFCNSLLYILSHTNTRYCFIAYKLYHS